MVKSFVSTEARILQQPHFPSSDFENFFSNSTTCAFDQLLASRQREANSTAFQTAVNRLFYRFRSSRSNHQQNQTAALPARRILRSFRGFATPTYKPTYCFIRSLSSHICLKSSAAKKEHETSQAINKSFRQHPPQAPYPTPHVRRPQKRQSR